MKFLRFLMILRRAAAQGPAALARAPATCRPGHQSPGELSLIQLRHELLHVRKLLLLE